MKKTFILFFSMMILKGSFGQQNYCDFEGTKTVSLAEWNGQMDSAHVNPGPNGINSSSMCAKYIRDTALYDNFKFFPYSKLIDVSPYSTFTASQKLTMKVFSSAPAGTRIDLQLGSRSYSTYPQGVHSIYSATTTAQNAWELITFNYVMIPTGSMVNPTDIDKIVILMHPGSNARDTLYFDDPTGPQTTLNGIKENTSNASFKLFQNKPNPAKDNTEINLQLNTPGYVSLKLYDILGKPVSNLIDQVLNEGTHSVSVKTSEISNGIYFYVLKKDGITQTVKMTISK